MYKNIQERWNTSSNTARIGLLVGVLAIVAISAGLFLWSTRDNYQVLFSDLDPQDAATMAGELEKMKMPYRLDDGGKSILVDKDAVYKTRLKLMGQGVNLRGTVGFEIFNTTDFGTTEFAQKINYQRALQGELARTIMDFDEIKFARVHLVMPESGLFKKNNVKPKASISLVMKGDSQLSADQVTGIQRLVAASVPEIDPAAVTVLDQRGVALTRKTDAGGQEAEGIDGRLEVKKQIEAYLTRKIADMLDKAVGAGQAIVSVDATLTQDHIKITREDVIPLSIKDGESAGSIVRRRNSQQKQTSIADADNTANGIAKISTDGVSPQDASKKQKREDGSGTVEVEYQNGRKVEQSVSLPGSLKRVSVGVLLPNTVTEEQLEKIRQVVSMAAGINSARGDSIAIYSIEQFAEKAHTYVSPATVAVTTNPTVIKQAPSNNINAPVSIVRVLSLILCGFAILAAGVLLLRERNRRNVTDTMLPELSESERLRTLAHIKQWLATGDVSRSGACV